MRKGLLLKSFILFIFMLDLYLFVNHHKIESLHTKIFYILNFSLVVVVLSYIATNFVISRIIKNNLSNFHVHLSQRAFNTILFFSVVSLILFILNVPDTSFTIFIKNYINGCKECIANHHQLRLSSYNLPIAILIPFEFCRRVLIPILLIESFVLDNNHKKRLDSFLILIFVSIVNVIYTIDRSIGVIYLSICIFGLIYKNGLISYRKVSLYFLLLLMVVNIVVLKHIQYGEYWSNEKMANIDWKVATINNIDTLVPIDRRNHADMIKYKLNHSENNQNSQLESFKSVPSDVSDNYLYYIYTSITGRFLLSPLQMIEYSLRNYNNENFLYFTHTRLLAYFGLAKLVDPLSVSDGRYNKSFPVGFLGDLWRNGGLLFILIYSIILGIFMSILDFRSSIKHLATTDLIGLIGILSLFYSNALSGTPLALIFTALLLKAIFIYINVVRK